MTDPETIDTYQTAAEAYRERNSERSSVEQMVESFLAAVADTTEGSPGRIADVGCGPGWESATFGAVGHDVVAVDLTPAFLRLTRDEAPDADVARMDMRTLGVGDDCLDGLWVCASFLHVPREDAPDTLSEFWRVLRSGGVLLLSVKAGDGARAGDVYDEDSRRFTLYRPNELQAMVEAAGFEVLSVGVDDETWIQLLARA